MRYPNISDLKLISEDIELEKLKIIGRNQSLYLKTPDYTHKYFKYPEIFLRNFPSLCSDIYSIATKLQL